MWTNGNWYLILLRMRTRKITSILIPLSSNLSKKLLMGMTLLLSKYSHTLSDMVVLKVIMMVPKLNIKMTEWWHLILELCPKKMLKSSLKVLNKFNKKKKIMIWINSFQEVLTNKIAVMSMEEIYHIKVIMMQPN
jgi:hypothetical protein